MSVDYLALECIRDAQLDDVAGAIESSCAATGWLGGHLGYRPGSPDSAHRARQVGRHRRSLRPGLDPLGRAAVGNAWW